MPCSVEPPAPSSSIARAVARLDGDTSSLVEPFESLEAASSFNSLREKPTSACSTALATAGGAGEGRARRH